MYGWVVGQFLGGLGLDVLAEIARVVRVAQGDALGEMSRLVREGVYTHSVARDLFPHKLRARVETDLFSLADSFSGVRVESRYNRSKNSHTIVKAGPVLLTASSVPRASAMPRWALFREMYSRHAGANGFSGQLRFEVDGYNSFVAVPLPLVPAVEGEIYGIILYASSSVSVFDLGYIGIGFPDREHKRYVGRVDIMDLCPYPVARSEAERVDDLLNLQFLTQVVPVPDFGSGGGVRRTI